MTHSLLQTAVEAPISDKRIRELFVEHGYSDPLPTKESLLYELCRAAAREGWQAAIQQQPEPVGTPASEMARAAMTRIGYLLGEKPTKRDQVLHEVAGYIRRLEWLAERNAAPPALPQREPVAWQFVVGPIMQLVTRYARAYHAWQSDADEVGDNALFVACEKARKELHEAICNAVIPPALQQKEEPSGWWCAHCQCEVAPRSVTYEETHDVRAGGCGHPVAASPSPAEKPAEDSLDARRYRWLRAQRETALIIMFFGNGCINKTIEMAEAELDAAMGAEKPAEGEPGGVGEVQRG